MVETYSSMGLGMALYVTMIVSFCFPHVVDVSALSICIVLRAPGVKRVHVFLSGLRMRLFVRVHVCISCRYD